MHWLEAEKRYMYQKKWGVIVVMGGRQWGQEWKVVSIGRGGLAKNQQTVLWNESCGTSNHTLINIGVE